MYRNFNCGELRLEHTGRAVVLAGWLHGIRDLGSMAFLTLRDFYGVTQVYINDAELIGSAKSIPRESVIRVSGIVAERSNPNKELPTGLVEVIPDEITVINPCREQLPFEIAQSTDSREETRLKYRYLDMRNPVVKDNLILRSGVIASIREQMTKRGFIEIQTPILTSSSPEGARDYLVPSRLHPGKFYALPQAPQQFKQILMAGGIDKYFQIAPCFRDEDARADRSPGEFYQLDMEMSFAEQEDVFAVIQEVLYNVFTEHSDRRIESADFPRITYNDSMEKYGTDKPDLRNPLVITDVTALCGDIGIPFMAGKRVKAIYAPDCVKPRRFFDEMSEYIKQNDGNIAWLNYKDGALSGSVAKFFTEDAVSKLSSIIPLEDGSSVIFIFGDNLQKARKSAGLARDYLGEQLDIIEKDYYKFCWIVDFPMYELNDDTGRIDFSHNPFSMPQGGMDSLQNKDPLDILAYQYDIVCNGIELSSGAVRNHDIDIMVKAFAIAGYDESAITDKFPAMYNAFKFGVPPHAGIAPGIDRMVMLLADQPNIREVIAFPMNKSAQDIMMNAPNTVSRQQLDDVSVKVIDI
ncbi:MAG: aspartate--tRNA ligase [Oscillospiraceae bacterium]|nr:aspartate--tRNA ligase [Oscillospiraceae bacterium]